MQSSDNHNQIQLKDDLNRTLRSSSPAIKRPASVMGAQDREEYTRDVEMKDQPALPSSPTNAQNEHSQRSQTTGKRQRSNEPSMSVPFSTNPRIIAEIAPSEDNTSISDSLSQSHSKSSTAATSLTESSIPAAILPPIDEQIVKVKALIEQTPIDKQKGFVVSARWLRRVQARSSSPPLKFLEKSATEGEIGPVDNSDIAQIIEETGDLRDEAGEIFVPLRPGLAVGDDLEILPEEAWNLVLSWYGVARTSPVITRFAHNVNEENPLDVQYELYPPIFSLLKVPAAQSLQVQKEFDKLPPHMLSSRSTPFMKWLKLAKELLHIDVNTKVRVWRILGGIKSNTASGILTPVASRSASPAPGAEIVASAGNRMILDVHTFALLQTGEQRQLIDHKDQTADANYNGKIDLQALGLGRDDVIVLEEQIAKTDGWASENLKLSLKGATKSKNLTPSGRSSPSIGIMTRGRAQRDGRPKGIVGLTNLGNTCYMNSALQCIRSVDELTEYFRSGYYKKEINYNNPLGHHGEIAKAYGNFIDQIYQSTTAFAPSAFKRIVGKYGPNFAGYGQQDSQEFLAFLLDGLQEDLNRIHKKPYIEKPDSTDEMVHDSVALKAFADRNWTDYKARNDSIVTDLFAGMYKSTLTCPVCDKVSIVFDPFSNLTLQLPIENNWSKDIIFFPLNKRPLKIDVDIDKNSSILDMKTYIAQRTGSDAQKMICAESYKCKFFKIFDNTEIISETSINANDVICVYELEHKPTNYNPDKKKKFTIYSFSSKSEDPKVDADSPQADMLLVPVYNRVVKPGGLNRTSRQFFGHPTYVVLTREDRRSYQKLFVKMIGVVDGMTTTDLLTDDTSATASVATPEDSDTFVINDDNSSGSESQQAKASSVQGEDGLVDVSMRDASQAPDGAQSEPQVTFDDGLLQKLQLLFDMRVVHTDEGIPTGFQNIQESPEYESIRAKAEKMAKANPRTPARSIIDEDSETSSDELADIPNTEPEQQESDNASDSGASGPQTSENDEADLPEPGDLISGKDSRGALRHQKKKTYSRKGRKIVGKAPRRTPPPPPQPRAEFSHIDELVLPGDGIILDWTEDAFEALFSGSEHGGDPMRGALTHRELDVLEDEELAAKRAQRTNRKKTGVSLQDCLNEYGKTETLSEQNAWYCPRCKEHRRADKQFELWKVPDILVMHLKRFSSSRNFRDKLELKVDYPVEGLDLSEMVKDKSDGKSLIYDLIAVDNHYGGLGGGHYTAYAKNSVADNWYDYNDSHVSQVKDAEDVVQKAAYLLFYRRRSEHPLGGPNLEKVLNQDSDDAEESRDSSPSGEGQRLGDSSQLGLSSASAGRVHHVGGGGLGAQNLTKMRQMTPDPEEDDQMRPIGPLIDDPPPYDDMSLDQEDQGIAMGPDPPWQQTWAFTHHTPAVPPSSNADEAEGNPLQPYARRSSVGSVMSSTCGAHGSLQELSDIDDTIAQVSDLEGSGSHRRPREGAPEPELPHFQISVPLDDTEEDLPVKEIKPPVED